MDKGVGVVDDALERRPAKRTGRRRGIQDVHCQNCRHLHAVFHGVQLAHQRSTCHASGRDVAQIPRRYSETHRWATGSSPRGHGSSRKGLWECRDSSWAVPAGSGSSWIAHSMTLNDKRVHLYFFYTIRFEFARLSSVNLTRIATANHVYIRATMEHMLSQIMGTTDRASTPTLEAP